jgi:hypothetical protein
MKTLLRRLALLTFCAPLVLLHAASPAAEDTSRDSATLAEFEQEALAAKSRGLTYVSITNGLPPALWEFTPAGDPYPAWFVGHPSLLKIFAPKELKPFVDAAYSQRAIHILEQRCAILRQQGLKGHWSSDEPQTLPEEFFQAYPKLRGPRVDQPNRARVPRFAPCVDQPETLRLYREALQALWSKCPEIDSFSFLTSDSGAGFCWVPGLYAGINGHSDCKERPMEERIAAFMKNFQAAADTVKLKVSVSINPIAPRQWMTPSFSPQVIRATAALLPAGMALSGREGPDGRPFAPPRLGNSPTTSIFYPVVGLPLAPGGGRGRGRTESAGSAPNPIEAITAQRTAAVTQVGEESANDLVAMWAAVNEAEIRLSTLDFGAMLRFGHVLTRWINRPMVPFPEELLPEDRDYFRTQIFQARDEDQANDLADVQGMLMYKGYGAKMLFQRAIETAVPNIRTAQACAQRIADRATDDKIKKTWTVHAQRWDAVACLLNSAEQMVSFQAHLDRVHELGVKPEYNPPLGTQSDWARTDMQELARKEIDNTVHLLELIQGSSSANPIIDVAPTAGEEYVMRLSPELPAQLKHKIDTMNAHWTDYDRIFTKPNL